MIARGKLTLTGLPADLGMVVFLGKPDPSGVRVVHPMSSLGKTELPCCDLYASRPQTLSGRWNTSKITRKGAEPHETQSQHFTRRGHHPTAPEEPGFCRRVPQSCTGR